MRFYSAASRAYSEVEERRGRYMKRLTFGVEYLDYALKGITPDDLILLGAPSGVGKTQLCCNLAKANVERGKRVHYIALEASRNEIVRRMKFPILMNHFFADPMRPHIGKPEFDDWKDGMNLEELEAYDSKASVEFETNYKDLLLFENTDTFGLTEFIENVLAASLDTDLIIVDHVHYFDFEDENENRAIKAIAKTARSLVLEVQKPIIIVAHLRKRDKFNSELVAGLDEFHGSSDLTKIATKVITLAPGTSVRTTDGEILYETFFRTPKNRDNGSSMRYVGRTYFSPRLGGYIAGKYSIGWASQKSGTEFSEIAVDDYPGWARRPPEARGDSDRVPKKQPINYALQGRAQLDAYKSRFGERD